jgi:hypothetical protein
LRVINDTHLMVVLGLVALSVSGLLLFAADLNTFLTSRLFWLKMALIGVLLLNGLVLLRTERRVVAGDERAWGRLPVVIAASLALWVTTTLIGAALPNL